MGFLIKFLLVFVVIYFLLKGFVRFLFGKRARQTSPRQPQRPEQAETQEERIIEYQKKTFEISEAEDVEFVEIKEQKGEARQ